MPLYLCTHAVEPSASVPLPMIVLLDLVKRKQILPATLRPRMVLPTSGATSVSVWDAPSAASLEAWLNEHLNQDVVHEVNEVQEDFSHGIAFELSRARTADRVAANSKSTLQKLSATASRAGDGFHRQLEALELGGSGGSFFGAAESALARIRGPPAATPPTSSAPSASSLGAQQDAADSMQVSRASSYYSWLQSKMKGTGLFPNHPPPRAAPPSTHASSYSHPSGLDMGLEGGAAPGMGLDAAAVAASTGPLPPSYAAAASAPSWEEDEPFVIGNDVGDSGGGGDAFGGSSSAVTQGQGLTVEGRSQGEGRPAPQQQQQQQQQDVQQQQQQHQQQEQRQPGQQEQQGVDQVLKLEEDSSADQGNQQQQQQQQSVGMPDTTVGGSGAGWQQQQPQQRRQQQQQQQQPNDAEKAPMFILGDDDDDVSGGHNQ